MRVRQPQMPDDFAAMVRRMMRKQLLVGDVAMWRCRTSLHR
jgi:hypothetical protein